MSRKHRKKNFQVPGRPQPSQPTQPSQNIHTQPKDPPRQTAPDRTMREQRANEYLQKALNQQDNLQANLGSINAGLMKIGIGLDESIQKRMSDPNFTLDSVTKLLQAVSAQVNLARQIDRLTHRIEQRRLDSRKIETDQHPQKPN